MKPKENLNVTIVQFNMEWENIDKNLEKLNVLLSSINPNETDIIVLPEMFNTGFCYNKNLAENPDGKTTNFMKELSYSKNCAVVGSLMIKEDEKIYNRMQIITNENVIYYNKKNLFLFAEEEKNIAPGNEKILFEIKGWKIRPIICYDIRFPIWCKNYGEYDVLLCVASWPMLRYNVWKTLLEARAIENLSYSIGVNRIGVDGLGFYYNGHSNIINPFGEKLINTKLEEENVVTVNLDYSNIIKSRKMFPDCLKY